MWMQFIEQALKDKPDHEVTPPTGIVSLKIDPNTGKRASSTDNSAIYEYFMLPYVPEDDNDNFNEPEISSDTGTLDETPLQSNAEKEAPAEVNDLY